MPAQKKKTAGLEGIVINPPEQRGFTLCIKGVTRIIFHKMSQKAKREILLPKGRGKKDGPKHDPLEEFRESVYYMDDYVPGENPTIVGFPSPGIKQCIAAAATDIPEAVKAVVMRRTKIPGYYTSIYGVPEMLYSTVRLSGPNGAPDARFRCTFREWAAEVQVLYNPPGITQEQIVNLAANAGLTIGLGDWRQQKGSGDNGQFELVNPDDPDFIRIKETGGREVQHEALTSETPLYFDEETQQLCEWYEREMKRRELSTNKAAA
jgi:hypothetical protein